MSRLTEALRKLGSKLTGKSTVQSNNITTILDDIANDYEAPTFEQTQVDWNQTDNTKVDYVKNKPTIIEVTANPTLAGTEANLTGLQIGGTKYKVPQGGGSTKYLHSVYGVASFNDINSIAMFTFMSNDSTPITLSSLFNYLNEHRDVVITTYIIDSNNSVITETSVGYDENLEAVVWYDKGIEDITSFVDLVSINLDIV